MTPDDLTDIIAGLRRELVAQRADVARIREAAQKSHGEICDILGAALYGPMREGDPGPAWSCDTAETLAEQAAERIERLEGVIAKVREAANASSIHYVAGILAILDESVPS